MGLGSRIRAKVSAALYEERQRNAVRKQRQHELGEIREQAKWEGQKAGARKHAYHEAYKKEVNRQSWSQKLGGLADMKGFKVNPDPFGLGIWPQQRRTRKRSHRKRRR